MLFSHNSDLKKISVFSMFLEDSISGDGKYNHIVDKIINDAFTLSKNNDYIYSIDRNYFSVITMLSSSDYFKSLTNIKSSFDKDTYIKVSECLPQFVC
ncbi:MAG: hypothetical protein EAZ27_04690 [Cytophagales bacterium]|nr:MAG: hypothetical protein EAZ27_04690 [Cytophagales bacterium]